MLGCYELNDRGAYTGKQLFAGPGSKPSNSLLLAGPWSQWSPVCQGGLGATLDKLLFFFCL